MKDNRRQRNQDDVAHLRCRVRNHGAEHDCRRQQVARSAEHESANARRKQTGTLSHTDTKQRDEHRSERRKRSEVRHEPHPDSPQAFGVDQTHRTNNSVGRAPLRTFRPRVHHFEPEPLAQARDRHDADAHDCEERDGVRKEIAEPLDEGEEPLE